ncbi:MAG: HEAT repeat domain-containing protein, partial [Nodosilinea sp.]
MRYGQRLILLFTALSVLGATPGYAQTCAAGDLQRAIQRLQDDQGRGAAQVSLKQCGEPAVDLLIRALSDPQTATRLAATQTLGQMGWVATAASPFLVAVAQGDPDLDLRRGAVQALSQIARSGQAQAEQWQGWQVGEINHLKDLQQGLDQLLLALEQDQAPWPTKAQDLAALGLASRGLQPVVEDLTQTPTYGGVIWARGHLLWVVIGVGGIVVVMTYGAIFLCRPLLLLKLGDGAVQAIANLPQVGTTLSGLLKMLLPLKYNSHVLDAWVTQQLATATEKFTSPTNKTVRDRAIHVPLPVKLNDHSETGFGPQTLQPYFRRSRFCLLLTGEGGAGKTSLACQIARWGLERKLAKYAILPILIEQELGESDNLLEVIQGYLQTLVAAEKSLDKTLVKALLRKRRLLVIVDHLSEMAETTRDKIRPADSNFPIHALIVTSRLPEDRLQKDVQVEPMRVEGNHLSEFINAYLTAKGKRHLFEDEEYFEVCRRLSRMVGQRTITVLLARLYTDQTIEQKEGAGGNLPDSIPDLMLSYLNQLNRPIEPANQRDQLQVQQDVQAIAWQCLKSTYRPAPAQLSDAIAALVAQGMPTEEAKQRLQYLENRLKVLETLEPGDKLRIMLDPLTEYLAATWLVQWFQTPLLQTAPDFLVKYLQGLVESQSNWADPQEMWRLFFGSIDQKLGQNETSEAIQGFLLAVLDCCLVKQSNNRIPEFVPEELARKAKLDPEELRKAEEKRRVRLLISELSAPELKFRIRAAEDLAQLGPSASMAAPNLIGMLGNRDQNLQARQVAAQTLGNLGIGAEKLLTVLTDSTDEVALRRSAAEALGHMKAGKVELLQILEAKDQPLSLRQGAARALSLIGAPSDEAVSMLVVTLPTGGEVKSIPVRREPLTDQLSL